MDAGSLAVLGLLTVNGQSIDDILTSVDASSSGDDKLVTAGYVSTYTSAPTEGTFTPALSPASGSLTHGTQEGDYIKIGDLVAGSLTVVASTLDTASGNVEITGLPFTSDTNRGNWAANVVNLDNFNNDQSGLGGRIFNNTSVITLVGIGTGTETTFSVTDMNNGFTISMSFVYWAA